MAQGKEPNRLDQVHRYGGRVGEFDEVMRRLMETLRGEGYEDSDLHFRNYICAARHKVVEHHEQPKPTPLTEHNFWPTVSRYIDLITDLLAVEDGGAGRGAGAAGGHAV